MIRMHRFIIAVIFIGMLFAAGEAHAAVISLVPSAERVDVNQEVVVTILVDTQDLPINAVEAVMHYSVATVRAVSVDTGDSIFDVWVESPVINAAAGTVRFVGGMFAGVSGTSLELFKIRFRGVGAGTAEISVTDASVIASDGRGTNVFAGAPSVRIVVGRTPTASPPTVSPVETLAVVATPQPQRVIREAVPARALPAAPKLEVPLYPNQERWYNRIGKTVVFWNLPEDVTHVAVAADQNPNTIPQKSEPALVNGKDLGALREGIWYVHVRFRNNVGWGQTSHYRISLDTSPPTSVRDQHG